ncbi:hypothetical protein Tco_1170502 [Tanacetum coccineum]
MAIARQSANLHPKHSQSQPLSSSGPFPRIEAWPSPRIEAWPSLRIKACPSTRIEAWPSPRIKAWPFPRLSYTRHHHHHHHIILRSPSKPSRARICTISRVFQTLFKQGHWFLFTNRHAPTRRHADSVITDPKPHTGSYDDLEVRRLSAFVMKLCDMPKGILVLPILIRKRKTSTSSQVTKRSRLAMTHAASGSARKNLCNKSSDDDDDDDEVCKVGEQNDEQDDDCVEILLIILIRRTCARTKDIVDGRVDTPFKNVARPYSSAGTNPFVVGPSSAAPGTSSND